jgi:hypothetical protein
MDRPDRIASGQISDRSGDFENAIPGGRGQAELLEGRLEQTAAVGVEGTKPAYLLGSHPGVEGKGVGSESIDLKAPRSGHPAGHLGRGLTGAAAQLVQADGRYLDVQVHAAHQRTGDPFAIATDESRAARARGPGITQMATGASLRSLFATCALWPRSLRGTPTRPSYGRWGTISGSDGLLSG